MAIDQTTVALNIASKGVDSATRIADDIALAENLLAHGLAAGISMTNFDSALETSSIKHVNGATVNKFFANVVPGIRDFLKNNSVGGETYESILYKMKK